MLKKLLYIFLMLTCKTSMGQYFLNGSFEDNISTIDRINVKNYIYDSLMNNSVSFGSSGGGGANGGNMDIIMSSKYCNSGAQDGNWYVALALTADSISLKLSTSLLTGYIYTISFYERNCSAQHPAQILIGVSNAENQFGNLIYTTLQSVQNAGWTKRTFSFVTPITAQYITVSIAADDKSFTNGWIHIDNFTIDTFTVDTCTFNLNLGNDTTICQGETLRLNATIPNSTYLWQNNTTDSVFIITQPGTYWVKVTNSCGTKTDTIHVTTVTPIPLNLRDTTLCKGGNCLLNAYNNAYNKYLWNTNDTTSTITIHDSGMYIVTASNGSCSTTDTVNVSIINLPPINLVHDTAICDGNTLTLDASNVKYTNYQWSTSETTPKIKVVSGGKYIVTASNGNCTTKDSTTLSIFTLPHLHLPPDTIVCLSQLGAVILNAGKFKTYYWYPTGEHTQIIAAVNPEIYIVVVTDSNNCNGSDTTLIDDNCPYQLYMPNIFTPTNDLLNETFRGYGLGIAQFEMHIYNRWGEELFITTDINKGWDGTFKNNPCTADVYVWKVTYRLKNETFLRTDKGNVTLLK